MERMRRDVTGREEPARTEAAHRAVRVLGGILAGRREQLVHDCWTLRSLFASTTGSFRRAGFTAAVLVRAAAAEMDRVGTLHGDPLDEAFWLLSEQSHLLNWKTVDARATATLWGAPGMLRRSQRQAALRLVEARARCLAHPDGGPASNLLLLAVLAGGLHAVASARSYHSVADARFPDGLPFTLQDEVSELLLAQELRQRLDERALALDRAAPASAHST